MRKLKMAAVLPVVHLVGYFVVFRSLFPYQEPTRPIRLWFAVNGPVLVLIDLAKSIATISWLAPHIMGGNRPIYFLLLFGGTLLWFLVGREFDHANAALPKLSDWFPSNFVSAVLGIVSAACGARLILLGSKYFFAAYPGQHCSFETIIEGSLVLLWSIILLMNSWRTLASLYRPRLIHAPRS